MINTNALKNAVVNFLQSNWEKVANSKLGCFIGRNVSAGCSFIKNSELVQTTVPQLFHKALTHLSSAKELVKANPKAAILVGAGFLACAGVTFVARKIFTENARKMSELKALAQAVVAKREIHKANPNLETWNPVRESIEDLATHLSK